MIEDYYYLQNGNSLGEVFAEEFTSASATVASGLGVDVTLPPGVELIDAGGFPIERDGRDARFQIGALFGGQERSIWLTFRVPTDAVRAVEIPALGLGWTDGDQRLSLAVRAESPVDCVEGKAAALAGIDKDAWEQSVVQEEWGALRQEVARDVQEGRKDAAKEKVEAYRSRLGEANGYVQSAAVSKNLDDAAALQDEVDAAFAAPDAAAQRNELSKKASSEAWSERKVSRKQ